MDFLKGNDNSGCLIATEREVMGAAILIKTALLKVTKLKLCRIYALLLRVFYLIYIPTIHHQFEVVRMFEYFTSAKLPVQLVYQMSLWQSFTRLRIDHILASASKVRIFPTFSSQNHVISILNGAVRQFSFNFYPCSRHFIKILFSDTSLALFCLSPLTYKYGSY